MPGHDLPLSDVALSDVAPPWRWAFEEAWASWIAGSLGIGCVLVGADGEAVARGRNRVLEPAGSGPVAGTLLAHAEMDGFAALGLRTAAGLTLFTTVEPCLMCSSTAIAMRLSHIRYASPDPVFEGLADALGGHPYAHDRTPTRTPLDHCLLAAVGNVLPLANRAWARPGLEPRPEWLHRNAASWRAAVELVESGTMSALATGRATVDDMVATIAPTLVRHGAT